MNKDGKLARFISFIKEPNLAVILINWFLTLGGIGGSVACVVLIPDHPGSIAVYVLSFVSLAYSVYTAIRFTPGLKQRVDEEVMKSSFARNMKENYPFRTTVFALISVVIDIGFLIFSIVMAVLNNSIWYYSLSGYYFILLILRILVLYLNRKAVRKYRTDERECYRAQLKIYRAMGIALLVLDAAITSIVYLTVFRQRPTVYDGVASITYGVYATWKIFLALRNVRRARRTGDPAARCLRNISLADALVTLLSFQTALIAFYSEDESSMFRLNALTGTLICVIVLEMGIYMIYRSTKDLKSLPKEEDNGPES